MRTAGEVPTKHLTPAALNSLAEESVTRDGTDYGQVEKTLEEKVAALMRRVDSSAARPRSCTTARARPSTSLRDTRSGRPSPPS